MSKIKIPVVYANLDNYINKDYLENYVSKEEAENYVKKDEIESLIPSGSGEKYFINNVVFKLENNRSLISLDVLDINKTYNVTLRVDNWFTSNVTTTPIMKKIDGFMYITLVIPYDHPAGHQSEIYIGSSDYNETYLFTEDTCNELVVITIKEVGSVDEDEL